MSKPWEELGGRRPVTGPESRHLTVDVDEFPPDRKSLSDRGSDSRDRCVEHTFPFYLSYVP